MFLISEWKGERTVKIFYVFPVNRFFSSSRYLFLAFFILCFHGDVHADSDTTREALERVEELLEMRMDDGVLHKKEMLPAILISALPRYHSSKGWYTTQALVTLSHAFGTQGLRMCEACMVPRTYIEEGQLHFSTGPMGMEEIAALDKRYRGKSEPARTAIWLNETNSGVSLRIVDIKTSRVLFAQNIDPNLRESRQSTRQFLLARELERRARGDSLTHAFIDTLLYPNFRLSFDWTEQWGEDNSHFSGITLSMVDPFPGVGVVYYKALNVANIMVGGQLVMSLLTALTRVISEDGFDVFSPLLTGVLTARIPFGASNYGAVITASSNGVFGIGISLLNVSIIPVIP